MPKKQYTKYIFYDFLILLLIFLFLFAAIFFTKIFLFRAEEFTGSIWLSTRALKEDFLPYIKPGDIFFDNVTKRRLGEVKSITTCGSGDDVHLEILLNAYRRPYGGGMYSKDLFLVIDRWEQL